MGCSRRGEGGEISRERNGRGGRDGSLGGVTAGDRRHGGHRGHGEHCGRIARGNGCGGGLTGVGAWGLALLHLLSQQIFCV